MVEPSTLRRHRRSGGFTYLSLMIVIAIIALVAASAIKLGSVLQRSMAEQELLDIGAAFSNALKSYADATPPGMPAQPPSLKDLLKDPRFPGTRRHLRKIFVDPMTGKAEWGIVYRGEKTGVLAVYSLSDAKPVKIGNFPARYSGFEGKSHISDWKFTASAEAPASGNVANAQQRVPLTQQNNAAPNPLTPLVQPEPEKAPATSGDESVAPTNSLPQPSPQSALSEPAEEPQTR